MSKKQLLKVIILGDSGVGKTSLMHQYVSKKFDNRYKATIGADFLTKEIELDGQTVALQIWDTAGQERFQALGSAFYRGADACILVFDLTQADTFQHLSSWMDEFNLQAGKRDCVLIGNKSDLQEKRAVKDTLAKQWCDKNKEDNEISYFETSAKDDLGVEQAFLSVAKAALKRKSQTEQAVDLPAASVSLNQPKKQQKKDDGCAC